MTDSPPPPNDAPPPPPAGPPPPPQQSALRGWWESLRRSSSHRLLGGVCGGIAESTGIPRVLVILAFALASIPLIGIPVYALLWVLLPDENGRRVADDSRWRDVLVAAVACAVVLVVLGVSVDPLLRTLIDLAPWALILMGAVLIVRRVDRSEGPNAARGEPPVDASATTPPPFAPQPTPTQHTAAPTPAPATPSSHTAPPAPPAPTAPPAPRYRQPFRLPVVGALTWALAFIVVAVLGLVALGDRGALGPGTMLAAVTIVFGTGLVVSSFIGKARGLILPALACVLAVVGLGVLNVRADNTLDAQHRTIRSADDLPDTIVAGYGKSTVHLGALRLDGDRELTISQTAGVVWVLLPAGVNTELEVAVKVGTADMYRLYPERTDYQAWVAAGTAPQTGDLIDAERLDSVTDWSAQTRVEYLDTDGADAMELDRSPVGLGRSLSSTLDVGAAHTLRLTIELGVGEVRILQPRWAGIPDRVYEPEQACHTSERQTGPVPCSTVEPTARLPLCMNTAGDDVTYGGVFSAVVRCEDLPAGDAGFPLEPACLDWDGTTFPCVDQGLAVVGVERYPGDPDFIESGTPELPGPPDAADPAAPIDSPDSTDALDSGAN